jgi:hypothetical protein
MRKYLIISSNLIFLIACGRYRVNPVAPSTASSSLNVSVIDSAIERPLYELLLAREIDDADSSRLRSEVRSAFDNGAILLSHLDEKELAETVMGLVSRNYLSTCYLQQKCTPAAGPISADALVHWYQSMAGLDAIGAEQIESLRRELYTQLPETKSNRRVLLSH